MSRDVVVEATGLRKRAGRLGSSADEHQKHVALRRPVVRMLVSTTVVLIAMLVVHPVPAWAGSNDIVRRQFLLVRTTPGPASFSFGLNVEPGDAGGFIGVVGARVEPSGHVGHVEPVYHWSFGRHDDWGAVTPVGEVRVCVTSGLCDGISRTFTAGIAVWMEDEGGPEALNRFYVAVEGTGLDIDFDGDGWELVSTEFSYRYVDGSDVAPAGVYTWSPGVEVFVEARAAGGSGGSIAQALPPCSASRTSIVGRGVGFADLVGGERSPSVICPRAVFNGPLADSSQGRTTWVFQGLIAGDVAIATTRLWVVDTA